MKNSGIGGQAVIEGVMMRNKEDYAIAVRTPDRGIVVEKRKWKSFSEKHKFARIPVIRGVVAFIESLVVGISTLTYAASFFEEEDTSKNSDEKGVKKTKEEKEKEAKRKERKENITMGLTVVLSFVIAITVFMLLPYYASHLLADVVESETLLALIEGGIRLVIFVAYVLLISQMEDIKRVFMYHGAEHKSINCIENGLPLTVENAKTQSREHKRCGTSFSLYVMILSVIFFIFIRVDSPIWRVLFRLLLIPVIAGVSYEFIKFAGSSNSKVMAVLSRPGFWLQGLTTREPSDDMLEVAIKSVEAVFDWKAFLMKNGFLKEEQKEESVDVKSNNSSSQSVKKNSKKKKKTVRPEAAAATGLKSEAMAAKKAEAEKSEDAKIKKAAEESKEAAKAIDEERKTVKAEKVAEKKAKTETAKVEKAVEAKAKTEAAKTEKSAEEKAKIETAKTEKATEVKSEKAAEPKSAKAEKVAEVKSEKAAEPKPAKAEKVAEVKSEKAAETETKSKVADDEKTAEQKESAENDVAATKEVTPVVHRARVLSTGTRGHGGARKRTLQEELNQISQIKITEDATSLPESRWNQDEFEVEEEDEFLNALDHFFEDKK